MYILCIIMHYIINDDVIKTKCVYEGCMQLTYIQHMRKWHNDYMHNAHMQHARTMHVCKMHTFCILCILHIFCIYAKKYIFGAAHIPRICPILCKFFCNLHICKLTLNNKLHTCKLRAKYSQQYAQNVCSIFVREVRHLVPVSTKYLHIYPPLPPPTQVCTSCY